MYAIIFARCDESNQIDLFDAVPCKLLARIISRQLIERINRLERNGESTGLGMLCVREVADNFLAMSERRQCLECMRAQWSANIQAERAYFDAGVINWDEFWEASDYDRKQLSLVNREIEAIESSPLAKLYAGARNAITGHVTAHHRCQMSCSPRLDQLARYVGTRERRHMNKAKR